MSESLADRLNGVRQRIAETDQRRTRAQTLHEMATRRLQEVDEQIKALGVVDPDKAEEVLAAMETDLSTRLTALDAALVTEADAYDKIIAAGQ